MNKSITQIKVKLQFKVLNEICYFTFEMLYLYVKHSRFFLDKRKSLCLHFVVYTYNRSKADFTCVKNSCSNILLSEKKFLIIK